MVVSALFGIVSAILRFRSACVINAIACAMAAGVVFSQARTPRTSMPSSLTVLVFNTQSIDGDQHLSLERVLATSADVVALPELSPEMVELIETDPRVRALYPYFWTNGKRVRGQMLALSKWPAAELFGGRGPEGLDMTPAVVVHGMRIDAPAGPVGFVVIHPLAPKSVGWLRNGNSVIVRTIDVVNRAHRLGLPVIVAADLNATPTGWRSRMLHRKAGLTRAKPLLLPVGTWPAWSVWPFQIAIDDVWLSSQMSVTSWQTLPRSGSDHRPVLVGIRY